MRVRLQINYSQGGSLSVEQQGPVVRIGRDPDNELALVDKSCEMVSWRHAQIELTPLGAFFSDLKSLNGSFVDDQRVVGRVELKVGQLIRLGHTGPMLKVMALNLGADGKGTPPFPPLGPSAAHPDTVLSNPEMRPIAGGRTVTTAKKGPAGRALDALARRLRAALRRGSTR